MSTNTESHADAYADGFWEAAEGGTLVMQHCLSCDALQLYPRRRCVTCGSSSLDYVPASGRGTLYTFSVILRNPPSDFTEELPYALAVVRLDEGPKLLTRVVDTDLETLECDTPVRCVFVRRDGKPLPCFVPIEDQA
jgi:uncharacterized OB-fold protein